MSRGSSAWLPRFHLIAGDEVIGAPDFRERLRPVMEAGGGRLALHLRARRTTASRLFEVASWLSRVAGDLGALVVVNDRLDVALAAGADGVHLREDSLDPAVVRAIAGGGAEGHGGGGRGGRLLIGRSIHAPDQAAALPDNDLDYLFLGSVYPTRSHPGARSIGSGAVAVAAELIELPLLAIGGIEPETTSALIALGAHGVVVLSGVWRDHDPPLAVTRYLEVLHERGQREGEE